MTDAPSAEQPGSAPTGLRALLPDLAPWRASADFRRLWLSGLITNFGSFLTFVALPVQIKELTGSAAAVGAIGAVELVPLVVFGLYGGGPRRRLGQAEADPVVGGRSGGAVCGAAGQRAAAEPRRVAAVRDRRVRLGADLDPAARPGLADPPDRRPRPPPAAAAPNALRWQAGGIAGPALAGVVVAYAGLGWATPWTC
ncbi:Integral membrane protein OS=Streptomyces glaucescens OX=1907 GN=SGLAU_10270 PE=4 SV=1 [Streptomyces glaucescens]